MRRENVNRIIDALEVKYVKADRRKVLKPVELFNTVEQKDILLQCNQGFFSTGKSQQVIPKNSFYLFPRDQPIYFRHGNPPYELLGTDGFTTVEEREQFLEPVKSDYNFSKEDHVFSIIGLEVMIHGAIPFFSILELPSILVGPNEEMNNLMQKILMEGDSDKVGKQTLINRYTQELVVHICRFIYEHKDLQENIQKLDYLLDKRLIAIIQYIQENLDKDLSNNKIASLAYVSKDYVGQFFKSLTNQNLQDYIENRRLENAHQLLRSTNDNIQEIAHKVGFKDPAYFSRRFKIRFNQNAKEVRKTDNVIV